MLSDIEAICEPKSRHWHLPSLRRLLHSWKNLCKASHNFFKDSKSLLGLGKCQARDFASQIACASLAAIQYNLLSVVKRFNAYETIGALFRETCSGAMELTIVERIWGAVMEMVIAVTSVFNITDEEIYDAVINKSEELAHICEIYRLKMAV